MWLYYLRKGVHVLRTFSGPEIASMLWSNNDAMSSREKLVWKQTMSLQGVSHKLKFEPMWNRGIIFFQESIFFTKCCFYLNDKIYFQEKIKIKIILEIKLKITENWTCSAKCESPCKKLRTPCSNVNIAAMLINDLNRNVTICNQKHPPVSIFYLALKSCITLDFSTTE